MGHWQAARVGLACVAVAMAVCSACFQLLTVPTCRFDTTLTDRGRSEVRSAAARVRQLPPPDLLVVSPLTRAIQSAELAFEGVSCPRIVHPLATERLEHSSDVRQCA